MVLLSCSSILSGVYCPVPQHPWLLTFEAVGASEALFTDAARRVILGETAPVALAAHLRTRVDTVDTGAAQVRRAGRVAATAHWMRCRVSGQ